MGNGRAVHLVNNSGARGIRQLRARPPPPDLRVPSTFAFLRLRGKQGRWHFLRPLSDAALNALYNSLGQGVVMIIP